MLLMQASVYLQSMGCGGRDGHDAKFYVYWWQKELDAYIHHSYNNSNDNKNNKSNNDNSKKKINTRYVGRKRK